MYILGFDPGGLNRFGWASLRADKAGRPLALKTGLCSGASVAVCQAGRAAKLLPIAIGIDAPLFWVANGDRQSDSHVRKLVCAAGGSSGTVGHVNSLRGACLVQGVLTACRVKESWPTAAITEAHPKALLRVHPRAHEFLRVHLPHPNSEHERDAALAAYAALALVLCFAGWQNLMLKESAPFFPGGHEVSYWFPCEST